MHPRLRRCTSRASADALRLRATRASSWVFHPDRMADRLPPRMPAVYVLRVEASFAQLDRGLATDVEAVRAVHDHRIGLGQLAHPVLDQLGIAPLDPFGALLLPGETGPRPRIDDLSPLPGRHHGLHFLDADALDVAELGLQPRPGRGNALGVLAAQLERRPVEIAEERVDIGLSVRSEVDVVGMLV